MASYLNIVPGNGSIEVDHIYYSLLLQRTPTATDYEWPALRQAFETWLAPENFDADGWQRAKLSDLKRVILTERTD